MAIDMDAIFTRYRDDPDGRTMRQQAADGGYLFYMDPIPCRHGHRAPRSTRTGECDRCRADRWRRWKDRNRDKATTKLENLLDRKGRMGRVGRP